MADELPPLVARVPPAAVPAPKPDLTDTPELVIFFCSACAAAVAGATGEKINCSACGQRLLVPPPPAPALSRTVLGTFEPDTPPIADESRAVSTRDSAARTTCPFCGGDVALTSELAGELVGCPHCSESFTMPGEKLVSAATGTTSLWFAAGRAVTKMFKPRSADGTSDERESRPVRRRPAEPHHRDNSLARASLLLGGVTFLFSLLPCIGALSIPVSWLGLVLGIIGGMLAVVRGRDGFGHAIGGIALCILALMVGNYWLGLMRGGTQSAADASKRNPTDQVADQAATAAKYKSEYASFWTTSTHKKKILPRIVESELKAGNLDGAKTWMIRGLDDNLEVEYSDPAAKTLFAVAKKEQEAAAEERRRQQEALAEERRKQREAAQKAREEARAKADEEWRQRQAEAKAARKVFSQEAYYKNVTARGTFRAFVYSYTPNITKEDIEQHSKSLMYTPGGITQAYYYPEGAAMPRDGVTGANSLVEVWGVISRSPGWKYKHTVLPWGSREFLEN